MKNLRSLLSCPAFMHASKHCLRGSFTLLVDLFSSSHNICNIINKWQARGAKKNDNVYSPCFACQETTSSVKVNAFSSGVCSKNILNPPYCSGNCPHGKVCKMPEGSPARANSSP